MVRGVIELVFNWFRINLAIWEKWIGMSVENSNILMTLAVSAAYVSSVIEKCLWLEIGK